MLLNTFSLPAPIAKKEAIKDNVDAFVNHKAVIDISLEAPQPSQSTQPGSLEVQEFWLPLQELRGIVTIRATTKLRFDKLRIVFEGL